MYFLARIEHRCIFDYNLIPPSKCPHTVTPLNLLFESSHQVCVSLTLLVLPWIPSETIAKRIKQTKALGKGSDCC